MSDEMLQRSRGHFDPYKEVPLSDGALDQIVRGEPPVAEPVPMDGIDVPTGDADSDLHILG